MTRRVLVAAVLTGALLAIVRTASVTKQDITDLPLHAYDLVTLSMSWSAQAALWMNHRLWILGLHCGGRPVGGAGRGGLALRRHPRAPPACARGDPCLRGVDLARDARAGRADARRDVRGEQPPRAVLRLVDGNVRGAVAGTGGRSGGRPRRRPFQVPAACNPSSKPPHIILDPRGVGGAALAVSRAELRQERRSVLSFA